MNLTGRTIHEELRSFGHVGYERYSDSSEMLSLLESGGPDRPQSPVRTTCVEYALATYEIPDEVVPGPLPSRRSEFVSKIGESLEAGRVCPEGAVLEIASRYAAEGQPFVYGLLSKAFPRGQPGDVSIKSFVERHSWGDWAIRGHYPLFRLSQLVATSAATVRGHRASGIIHVAELTKEALEVISNLGLSSALQNRSTEELCAFAQTKR